MQNEFGWDSAKAASNLAKHGVSFRRAARIFGPRKPLLERVDDRKDYGEERIRAVGESEGVLYTVVFT